MAWRAREDGGLKLPGSAAVAGAERDRVQHRLTESFQIVLRSHAGHLGMEEITDGPSARRCHWIHNTGFRVPGTVYPRLLGIDESPAAR